jgi:RNase P subunit RPR2
VTCDHCQQEFLRPGKTTVADQIVRRSKTGITLVARCWNCGKEMTFYLAHSKVNSVMQAQRRDAIKEITRRMRHKGTDTDRANEVLEDQEIKEQRMREGGWEP